ncbi:MAG: gamma carbonic anhydrase family protein [Marinifilaceae bacterium]|jgi:carbonic anhydrase/acetyltransferase-like protein (isoleucine patch superfamily)|nr:gamma carbonic anhydrase family protein [Marinifilaceae bacterium]
MGIIRTLKGKSPKFGENCFIADNAAIIGDVEMGDGCSIWFGAVLRGDVHYIKLGNNVNIQDNATIHATYKKSPTNIGDNVSIAHNAVVHGCTIKDNVLIGMSAVVLDDAVIESNAIVAAGAVVTKGTVVESGSVYAGSPAKKIKDLSPELLKGEINRIADSYAMYASWYDEE